MKSGKRSRIVLGLGTSKFASKVADEFRSKGWDVQTAVDGEEARRTAVRDSAHAVVVPFEPLDELSTAKVISSVPPDSSVVMISPLANLQATRFALLIGVAMAVESAGVAGIVSAVEGAMLLKA